MLLLDEISSSVDALNEKMIFSQILNEFKDRTIITPIHQLHLLEMFDLIIVMDQGQIVESGTLDELHANDRHFSKMWKTYLSGLNDQMQVI
ncbi:MULTISPECIES: ABC transporter ATP-binding protein/permease [unclassified Fusibacter]|uniref:ABC transporter ATP-binding protein/permease n=1 Tax=unclassified Fusibacter TaxID=2624464 RepID=UPI001010810A|nr:MULTISPECIES: ABC transporter ATP-binding protein/permease [unclassified Fusibacter]MCK8058959.1 ABC transporter ATP-binding protein/permease [Fusibacter sp. A2]RXV61600.1 ABC transporter ATP-binding protein [Fusibacter sp. A1]